jgi:hypothetical protein
MDSSISNTLINTDIPVKIGYRHVSDVSLEIIVYLSVFVN